MNLFEDVKQRVNLLNSQLREVQQDPGSETRKILYTHLWGIIEELNQLLGLHLENTALDLFVEGNRLVIHYFQGKAGSADDEVFIRIAPSFSVKRHMRNLGGVPSVSDCAKPSDLPPGIEKQGDGWGN
jgi:hypothetical protein